jgi:hypothetical protein
MLRSFVRPFPLVVLPVAVALGAIACGESSSSDDETSTSGAGGAGEGAGTSGPNGPTTTGGPTTTTSSTTSGGGGAPPEGVPMFVAIGKFGRITMSCDDGQSWLVDSSDDDGASCVGIDCDHHPGSSTGLTHGGGYFIASFGWGDVPSRIRRSADGVTWETVYDQTGFSFAGVVWAGDRLIGGDATPRYSMDLGVTFQEAAWPDYQVPDGAWPNARRVGFLPGGTGKIALLSGSGDGAWGDTTISSDGGATYQHPTTLPDECRGYSQGMASGNGVWLQAWGGTGTICRSTDGGDNWSAVQPFGDAGELSNVVFNGSEFVAYTGTTGYRSTDGETWTSFEANVSVNRIAYSSATGTYVMVDQSWDGQPGSQRFYRSADGVTWDELEAGAFVDSHPIAHVLFGYGEASEGCPR